MAEYIEREALQKRLELHQATNPATIGKKQFREGYYLGLSEAEIMVAQAQKADVAPVQHGRWEWLGPNELVKGCMCGTCSACKVRSKYIVNTGICPVCGARMDLRGADNGE